MLETRLIAAVAAAATLAACSGGSDGGTNPVPAIAIALSGSTLSVTQGTTGSVTVSLTRSGGFTGDVSITVEGLPSGVTYTATPASLGSAVSSSVITIGAGGTATPATTNLTVRATGTGVTAQTATLALTVVAAPTPTYTIAVASGALSVAQGATAAQTVNLTRTGGFGGAVALTAEGLPAGVTGAFNPVSVTANTSALTLTATATATAGTSTITIRGTATGQTDKTVTFQLTVTAVTAGNFTLSLTPAALTVQQGANGTSTVTITRTGGFAGNVDLTATGLPNGVTAAFNPAGTTGNTSTLTLTASATAATGAVTVTVRGNATGLAEQTATLALTVNAPAGGYTLSMNPTALSVAQGANGTSTVTINRTNGFAGAVTLSASGLPNGVTAAFNPAAPTTNSSTLTLTASATATVGQATVTIKGTATGLTDQTSTLTLTVTASSGGSGNTTWEFCRVSSMPLWFAVQDGANGTWTRITPTGTKFQFNITQAKGGIAYVTGSASASVSSASQDLASRLTSSLKRDMLLFNRPTPTTASVARSAIESYSLTILYGAQAELNNQGTGSCLPGSGKTVNGTVAGLSAAQAQTAAISLGSASADASASNLAFQLKNVPDGALDLIATRSSLNTTTFALTPDKLIIRRGVNAADNSTLPVLDFGAAEAFDPASPNLTINNLGTDIAGAFTFYFTAAGSSQTGASLGFALPGAPPFKYYGVPAAKQAAGDLHLMFAISFPSLQNTGQSRTAGLYFKDAIDRTVTLGPVLTAPTVTAAATTPYVRFRATAAIQAEYNQYFSLSFTQSNTTLSRSVSITATAAYMAGAAAYDFTVPDFTTTAGWDNNWGPKVGIATTWSVSAYAVSGTGFGSSTPTEGASFKAGGRSGTITP